jgi:hypothetical protein
MMNTAIRAAAALLAMIVGFHTQAMAGEKGAPGRILGALEGTAVPAAQLGREHARGAKNITVDNNTTISFEGSLSEGALRGNSVIGNSTTGTITTTGSINNNTGITTVFQNSGNNSLFQQTMAINITVQR